MWFGNLRSIVDNLIKGVPQTPNLVLMMMMMTMQMMMMVRFDGGGRVKKGRPSIHGYSCLLGRGSATPPFEPWEPGGLLQGLIKGGQGDGLAQLTYDTQNKIYESANHSSNGVVLTERFGIFFFDLLATTQELYQLLATLNAVLSVLGGGLKHLILFHN